MHNDYSSSVRIYLFNYNTNIMNKKPDFIAFHSLPFNPAYRPGRRKARKVAAKFAKPRNLSYSGFLICEDLRDLRENKKFGLNKNFYRGPRKSRPLNPLKGT